LNFAKEIHAKKRKKGGFIRGRYERVASKRNFILSDLNGGDG